MSHASQMLCQQAYPDDRCGQVPGFPRVGSWGFSNGSSQTSSSYALKCLPTPLRSSRRTHAALLAYQVYWAGSYRLGGRKCDLELVLPSSSKEHIANGLIRSKKDIGECLTCSVER